MPRTRTFIAVDLGKAIRERIVALQQTLAETGADVKWVEPENLHVTLLFLGEVDDRRIPDVCRLVSQQAGQHSAFPMSIETVGSFPNPRRPRIVWVGVGEGALPLVALHDALEAPLQDLGYRREERRYTPHVTLGRVQNDRSGDSLAPVLGRHAAWKAGEILVRDLRVMGSELTPRGPLYTVLGRAPLAKESPPVDPLGPE